MEQYRRDTAVLEVSDVAWAAHIVMLAEYIDMQKDYLTRDALAEVHRAAVTIAAATRP